MVKIGIYKTSNYFIILGQKSTNHSFILIRYILCTCSTSKNFVWRNINLLSPLSFCNNSTIGIVHLCFLLLKVSTLFIHPPGQRKPLQMYPHYSYLLFSLTSLSTFPCRSFSSVWKDSKNTLLPKNSKSYRIYWNQISLGIMVRQVHLNHTKPYIFASFLCS